MLVAWQTSTLRKGYLEVSHMTHSRQLTTAEKEHHVCRVICGLVTADVVAAEIGYVKRTIERWVKDYRSFGQAGLSKAKRQCPLCRTSLCPNCSIGPRR
jgi:hypothetical protein